MSTSISGFGLQMNLVASVTFPQGVALSQFADDVDPVSSPDFQIADTAMGLNGDMVNWSVPTPLEKAIGILPNTEDDRNLSILVEANRVAKGKVGASDQITLTIAFPDGATETYTGGVIVTGNPSRTVQSAGRLASKTYTFRFENMTSTAATSNSLGGVL